tara:strand:- start:4780 stop:5463 length:684 start_codon:yes stop_codon:yes gene_type:complete
MPTADDLLRSFYQDSVLDATHPVVSGDSGGFGFSSFTTDYYIAGGELAPDIRADVRFGEEAGDPASPFVPNPRIDGIPFTGNIPDIRASLYGSGHNATSENSMPSVTSLKIQSQTLVGYMTAGSPGYLTYGAAYERADVPLFPPPPIVYEPPPIDWTSPSNLGLADQALAASQAAEAAAATGDEELAASLIEKAAALYAEAQSLGHQTSHVMVMDDGTVVPSIPDEG